MAVQELLAMRSVGKAFPGVVALKGVDFSCLKGEVHALVGHNGAGKSTLIKILGGVYDSDQGRIVFKGRPFNPKTPVDGARSGISIIHQEFNLFPDLTVAQNIYLGREPINRFGLLDKKAMLEGSRAVLARLKVTDIDPRSYVRSLSVNQLQLVEIAKALSVEAELIVMDEPTAALPLPDVRKLFDIIRDLRARGVTVIYISHRLEEVFQVCDRVTLMRDGLMLATLPLAGLSREELIERMVGRSIVDFFPTRAAPMEEPSAGLVAKGLRGRGMARAVSFSVGQGEIFGLTGLEGCGASELGRTLFGAVPAREGQLFWDGEELDLGSPRRALASGLALVTKDRRREGLILAASLSENMIIPWRVRNARHGWLGSSREAGLVRGMMDRLDIKAGSTGLEAQALSGGNQQKVILAKWLLTECRLLIVDEPTRGVDVESKTEIYKLMRRLVERGVIVVVISSDMEEILGLCDRVTVMHRGQITACLDWRRAGEEQVMLAATGCFLDREGRVKDRAGLEDGRGAGVGANG